MAEIVEKFAPVDGYEGLYEVSNLGRIRSLRRTNQIILRGYLNKRNGYHQVMLYKNGNNKLCYTHIIVAKAFLPYPLNGETLVTHINGDKMDNRAENLVYKHSLIKKNIELAIPDGRIRRVKKEYAYKIRKYNLNGICLAEYYDFEMLELAGYKRAAIMSANSTGKKYKKYNWKVERN